MANKDFTLPSEIKSEIESMDCISQHNSDVISTLAQAIIRLTDDKVVISMLRHIDEIAQDSMNEVNGIAERLGANFRESNHEQF